MKIRISADSTCDLTPEYVREHNIAIVPLTVSMGGRDYTDGVDIVPDDIFRHVDAGGDLPKTAAVNTETYRQSFREMLQGADAVIHFIISADFSSSYENALRAAEGLPVYCVDSRNLSSGIALLLCEAVDLIEGGCDDPKAVVEHVASLIDKVDASFILDRLDFLYKGGRCSMVAMLGANLLKLRPCIEVTGGKMVVGKKFRGSYERCLKQYVDDRLRNPDAVDPKRVFITHTGVAPEQAGLVRSLVLERLPFEEVIECRAGCSITSHCGQGTLGVLFIRK